MNLRPTGSAAASSKQVAGLKPCDIQEMREEAIHNVVKDFSKHWCVPESAVMYAAQRMKRDSGEIPGLNNIKDSSDYAAYKDRNGDLPKFKYNQAMKKDLRRMILEDIIPLRDDDYRIEPTETSSAKYSMESASPLLVAEDRKSYSS